MSSEVMEREINLTVQGKNIGKVKRGVLEKVIWEYEKDIYDGRNPIAYYKQKLGIPEEVPFSGANILQLAKWLELQDEREGVKIADVMERRASVEDIQVGTEAELSVGGAEPSQWKGPATQIGSSIPDNGQSLYDQVMKVKTVTQAEARLCYHVAKMVMFLAFQDDLEWGKYVLEVAGFPKEAIEKEYSQAQSRGQR